MGKRIYYFVLSVAGLSLHAISFAQEKKDSVNNIIAQQQTAAAEDVMRSNDKIFVVMAVCITILVVLFLYLIRIDSKVSKLEKSQ